MHIEVGGMHFQALNEQIRACGDNEIFLHNVSGQRYIASGIADKLFTIDGVPGNALGAYLAGSTIRVLGNAQDATGDTMDSGDILIHGSSGDGTGYAMRGGRIFILTNSGYRSGIHMKEYKEHKPVIVIGGRGGDFLGEYQAGGLIIVLGIGQDLSRAPVGEYIATGMHGGKQFIRSDVPLQNLPKQVKMHEAEPGELEEIRPHVEDFAREFGLNGSELLSGRFFVLTPNSANPYKQMYTHN